MLIMSVLLVVVTSDTYGWVTISYLPVSWHAGTKPLYLRRPVRCLTQKKAFALASSYACELHNIVRENPNGLMMDEVQVLKEKLGIMTTLSLVRINLYEGTGRLSCIWYAQTNSSMDAIRAAILTTPDDIRKKKATEEWLRTRRNEVQVARTKLEEEGLL